MSSVQPNLIYFSGPHGSGKTSLIKILAKDYPDIMVPELYTRNLKFHTDATYRKFLKTAGRAIENFEYLQIAKENPDKIVIGNRCVYDVIAYDCVFLQRGWIDEITLATLELAHAFFREENEDPYAVIVNPGFDVTWRHLHSRWKKDEKKWNEDDPKYCRFACESYERYNHKGYDRILYIDKEVNLDSKPELDRIYEWMAGKRLDRQKDTIDAKLQKVA